MEITIFWTIKTVIQIVPAMKAPKSRKKAGDPQFPVRLWFIDWSLLLPKLTKSLEDVICIPDIDWVYCTVFEKLQFSSDLNISA